MSKFALSYTFSAFAIRYHHHYLLDRDIFLNDIINP